jgi:hypothetical protein
MPVKTLKPDAMSVASNLADVTIETIDPDKAALYLTFNRDLNRKTKRPTVDRYKRDMIAGQWKLSGDPIRFDVEGKMFDGQHRLQACIEAKTPFQSVVIRNLPVEIMNVVDSGRSRTPSDMLLLNNYTNTALLASAARWLMVMRKGMQAGAEAIAVLKPSNEEILTMVQRHPDLRESITVPRHPKGIPPSLLAAIHYVGKYKLKKAEYADAFRTVFVSGNPYYQKDDPALKLREMNLDLALKGARNTQRTSYVNAVYAWNAFADQVKITTWRTPLTISIRGLDPKDL